MVSPTRFPAGICRPQHLIVAALTLSIAACGGGAGGLTDAQRLAAVTTTASSHPACSTTALGDYYWEIGDSQGVLASGRQGGTVDADTAMNIASASKWPFAAYVVERFGDRADLVPYLNFTSGYSNFSNLACLSSVNVAACMNGGRNDAEAAAGTFHYQGGHMQQLAVDLGLGPLYNDGLGAEVRAVLGSSFAVAYVSPQPPGGIRTTPRVYGGFLRRLLSGSAAPLALGPLLGRHAVCTSPADGCANAAGESFLPENFHYALGHWVEDDASTTPPDNQAYSSAGAFGFYPWVDTGRQLYGLLARENEDLTVRQGYASLQCGRLLRQAWKTGAAAS